jgi:hypothetical protein
MPRLSQPQSNPPANSDARARRAVHVFVGAHRLLETLTSNILSCAVPAKYPYFTPRQSVRKHMTRSGYGMPANAAAGGRGAESGLRADQRD